MKLSDIIISTCLLSLSACGASGQKAESEVVDTDTIEVIVEEPILTELPDTVYPSIDRVQYKIDVFDDSLDATVTPLRDLYSDPPGAFTFRKGIHRQADFGGKVTGTPSDITVDWTFKTAFKGTWGGGSGWTGQPLYIEWPDSILRDLKTNKLVTDTFSGKEIMVGSLCGKVYFLDYTNGQPSRAPINVNNPIKGTMSLDPTLNGNLYVGHGVPDTIPFGSLVIDLYKNKVTNVFGFDANAYRRWGAYDSSPIRMGQYLFRPGENGTLYKWYIEPGKLKLQSTLRYTVNGSAPGMEASMAIYHNYGYVADNHGNILCVNLNTLQPIWHYALGDDIDSSIVLIEENGIPYIYTGCEVDRRRVGDARYIKLNALDGSKVWQLSVEARQHISPNGKHFDGGFYSTALPGTGDCDSLIFVNCVINDTTRLQNGQFMAINRKDGRIKYTTPLKRYAWSSPVGFNNESGIMYVVTGDCIGNVYVIEGITGSIICCKSIGANFESSPVVIGNTLVVGSRGQNIYKLSIK